MFNFNPPQNQYYPQFPQGYPSFPAMQPKLVIRQVGSIDEARNQIIDPMTIYFFADFGANKIYIKRMTGNGQSEFISFVPEQGNPLSEILQRLTNIENRLGGGNVQSNAVNDAGNAPENAVI